MRTIQLQFNLGYSFPIAFTRNVFDIGNPVLADIFNLVDGPCRIMTVIDSGVADTHPGLIEKIEKYCEHYNQRMEMAGPPHIMQGGESCKNDPAQIDALYALLNDLHLCRHSSILAIGGGAVLDAVGFAAATAHRGIRLLRLPTTTLAQNDAGVGVKNSVNRFNKKNFIGTFSPPFAVVNDLEFLKTLHKRDMRAGIAEAIKVALIKDRRFFDDLYENRRALSMFEPKAMEDMIVRCTELHTNHIMSNGDPFEQGTSRPLDFGHWAAHKIEDLAENNVRHGEAVAIGIALDSIYSHLSGLISEQALDKILLLITSMGFDLFHPALKDMDIHAALNDFQEHMGGRLTIPLIDGIGRLTETHEMDIDRIQKGIQMLPSPGRRKSQGSIFPGLTAG